VTQLVKPCLSDSNQSVETFLNRISLFQFCFASEQKLSYWFVDVVKNFKAEIKKKVQE